MRILFPTTPLFAVLAICAVMAACDPIDPTPGRVPTEDVKGNSTRVVLVATAPDGTSLWRYDYGWEPHNQIYWGHIWFSSHGTDTQVRCGKSTCDEAVPNAQ